MSRHFEKGIRTAQEVVASVGKRQEPTEPMTRQQVESFVKGFIDPRGSAGSIKQIVDKWMADQQCTRAEAYDNGWESRADAEYYNG